MTIFSKPKLLSDGTQILSPHAFNWTFNDKNFAANIYDDVVKVWKLGQLRGAAIGVTATVVLVATGVGIYKIVKAKKAE